MFDTALVATNLGRDVARKLATLPAALAVHAVAIGLVMVGQLWAVDQVTETESVPPLIVHIPPPPGGGGNDRPGQGVKPANPTHLHAVVVQPREIPATDAAKVGGHEQDPSTGVPGTEHLGDGTDEGGGGGGFGGGGVVGTGPDVGVPDDEPLRVGGPIVAPVPISQSMPEYPDLARKLRKEGVVIVQAVIDREGNVVSAEILRDIGFGCGEAAIRAVRGWKYRPAQLAGRPVTVYLTVTVNFELRGVS